MKKDIKSLEQYSLFQYRIFCPEGEEILQNGEIPESWRSDLIIDKMAIVTASNPRGKKLSQQANAKLNTQLGKYLVNNQLEYVPVQRESIDSKRFEADGKSIAPAFLIKNLSEEKAREIATLFDQEAFVYLEMDPELRVLLIGNGEFSKEKMIIFQYED